MKNLKRFKREREIVIQSEVALPMSVATMFPPKRRANERKKIQNTVQHIKQQSFLARAGPNISFIIDHGEKISCISIY